MKSDFPTPRGPCYIGSAPLFIHLSREKSLEDQDLFRLSRKYLPLSHR